MGLVDDVDYWDTPLFHWAFLFVDADNFIGYSGVLS
jgi:hypothetical protein